MFDAPRAALLLAASVLMAVLPVPAAQAQGADFDTCGAGGRAQKLSPGTGRDLRVTGTCTVAKGTYNYGNINILANGVLTFTDEVIDLWTKGIVIENNGSLIAGSVDKPIAGPLTIHLYGADQGTNPGGRATPCVTDAICGIPQTVWDSNGESKVNVNGPAPDYFYQYGPLSYDGQGTPIGYFGYKSIGVSYGGALQLFGKKGATYTALPSSSSGTSWARLNVTVLPSVGTAPRVLVLDRKVDWAANDKIVLTTTDYLPSHSEELTIQNVSADGTRVTVVEPIAYRHQGTKYNLPVDAEQRLKLNMEDVETRAAVALLTRSIRIVSEGAAYGQPLPATGSDSYFGGHVVARAGFKTFQMQGVELKQLGQGGRIGHYPVHFHMARTVPTTTFVKDNSVNESMTRWYVIHATNGVLFARNVGWKSIGHGFYIEEGSEADNKFQSNIGIYARPAIQNAVVNPRSVPGILAAPFDATMPENVPFYSDVDHPSVFWIMNGWNDFEYNMAAGAGACGACYWLVPGANSGHSRHMTFEGYASMQQVHDNTKALDKAATTPLRKFVGNYCTSAMNSFNTVGNTTACFGFDFGGAPQVASVPNPLAPPWCDQSNPMSGSPPTLTAKACANPANVLADDYYPKVSQGGGRFATLCPSDSMDCSGNLAPRCGSGNLAACMVTVIDRYTSSFHWAETNFGAIWLRPQWYLYTNSVLTDVQNGGITFVTGGGYTKSDLIQGHWALARKSVFIGRTQPVPPAGQPAYALETGPFNPRGIPATSTICNGNHCLSANDGVSFPISNFSMNQRLFNIYDGPAYQESNAYLDIPRVTLPECSRQTSGDSYTCDSTTLSGRVLGMPFDTTQNQCYLPNAAIAWKQPNGFYYPPAFHSENLYFANVAIRHYVIQPLFQEGTYLTDLGKARGAYCNFSNTMFNNWTDIDRQTELSDDDGSLTGYAKTVSVNVDPFFNAPVEAIECASDNTAKTSPYEYVTSVVYPGCAVDNSCGRPAPQPPIWDEPCTTQNCYGVPMYRQLLVKGENVTGPIKMAGQSTYQRSTLTPNNGVFYIDTTVSETKQRAGGQSWVNVFEANKTYYLFMLFAKSTTAQTYQIYVGDGFDPENDVWATQANISGAPSFSPKGQVDWASTGWAKSYANGILTVTMNMGFKQFQDNYNKVFQANCQPASFCSWQPNSRLPQGGTCGCNATGLYADLCNDKSADGGNVCTWAQRTVDCPAGGCYGIAFKTGTTFVYDPPVSPRPAQACFPKDAKWNVTYVPAQNGIAQSCTNAPKLPLQFCN